MFAEGKGVSTNIYGFYSITLPQRPTTLNCTFIGYAPSSQKFDGTSDMQWNVELDVEAVEVMLSLERLATTHRAPIWERQKCPWPQSNGCPH